ncbi:DNA polymerase III subunit chi [Pseudoruegeria sp. HB172150]|uniref:DNA polymerase III subunit chi n=1 Tax=Pseudoruegeria sp. HB172150 TaxID=2721164 RepID=UPI0015552323|nr:DNA polymerase III subunit chi [Pseudoruegeria sp. HB172150]
MGAAYFYHLTRAPLEATLPMLLGKARQAGWRVAVRGTSKDRMTWLDDKLWLGPEEQFLPHGLAGGEFDADQPVLLTTAPENPNNAQCLMTIDGAGVAPEEVNSAERVCILFDGNDPSAVETARGQWRELTQAGCAAQYWSQESGNWAKMAESN